MAELDTEIKKLEKTSKCLNDKTDELTKFINAVEARINETKPGVAVVLSEDPIDDEHWHVGYGKIGEKWHITVQRTNPFAQLSALSCAPRGIRVKAVPLLGKLVKTVHERVQEFLASVEEVITCCQK